MVGRALALLGVGALAVGLYLWFRAPAAPTQAVVVVASDAAPAVVVSPEPTASTPPDAGVAAPRAVLPVDAAARPAPPKHATPAVPPPVARQAPRGAGFTSLVAKYVPADQLPKALSLVADTCEQERTLVDDAMAHLEANHDVGKPGDSAAEGEAAKAIRDGRRDLHKALAALPGSKFNKDALIELTGSEKYLNDCAHSGDDE